MGVIGYDQASRYGVRDLAKSYRTSPILRDVTSKIAFSVASVQWKLYEAKNLNTIKEIGNAADNYVRRSYVSELTQEGEIKEIFVHPFFRFWNAANPYMTGLSARKLTQLYLDLPGEAFWVLKYGKSGRPAEYWPVPPNWVKSVPEQIISLDDIREMRRSDSYRDDPSISYKITIGAKTYLFAQDEVVWMREIDIEDPYGRGSGIGYTLGDEVETNEYASKFLKSYFINSGRPEMIFAVDGAQPEELQRAEANYNNKFSNFWNASKSFWTSGKIEVKELTARLVDMDVLNLRKDGRNSVGTVYGVPPELRAIVENSNRATIDSSFYLYNKVTVVPRLEFLRTELQEKVLPMFDDSLLLDYVSPVPEDKEYELNVLKAAPYAATRAEWRARAGLVGGNESDDVYVMDGKLAVYDAEGNHLYGGQAQGGEGKEGKRNYQAKAGPDKISPLKKAEIEKMVNSLDPELLVLYTLDYHQEELSKWAQSQLDELGTSGIRFDLQDPVVQAHLRTYAAEHVKNINDTTRDMLRQELLEGVKRGEGYRALSRRVSSVMRGAKTYRANNIARTEVVASSNFGSLYSFKESGIVEKKKWLAVIDTVTRTNHIILHGKKAIPIDDPFVVGDDQGLYPGGFSKAENNCQCRCTMLPVTIEIPVPSKAMEDDYIKRYLDASDIWEAGLKRRFISAFDEQEKSLQEQLRKYT